MIIIKEEFTAGAFDLPYVCLYSDETNKLKNTKSNKISIATYDEPLVIEKNKKKYIIEYFDN